MKKPIVKEEAVSNVTSVVKEEAVSHVTVPHTYTLIKSVEQSANVFLFENVDNIYVEYIRVDPNTFDIQFLVLIREATQYNRYPLRYICPLEYAPEELIKIYKEGLHER